MNEKLGPIYITDAEETGAYFKPYSKALDGIIDHEARDIISSAYAKTEKLLKDNRAKLEKVATFHYLHKLNINCTLFSWLRHC